MNRIEIRGIAQSGAKFRKSDGVLTAMLFVSVDNKGNRLRVMALHSAAEVLNGFGAGSRLKVTGSLRFAESGEVMVLAEKVEPLSGPETARAALAKVVAKVRRKRSRG